MVDTLAPAQTSQHLRISSPSDTAVEYTISSRTGQSSWVITILRNVFRIVVMCYTALATIAKIQTTFYNGTSASVELLLQISQINGFLFTILDSIPWWVLSITSLAIFYLCVKRDYTGK